MTGSGGTAPKATTDDLSAARRRVDAATRNARSARIAAAAPLRDRARRRTRRFLIAIGAIAVLALVVAGGAIALWVHNRGEQARSNAATAALDASRAAVTTLLTADPADPQGYLKRALAVTTGAQRDRLQTAGDALTQAVGALDSPSTGEVLSAGLVTDPPSADAGAEATVLLVAEATDPQLVGGDVRDRRVTVEVTMTRTDSAWLISQAGQA